MGTWISHLRIAENLLEELNFLDEVAFLFGNLGPDCGKPNKDWYGLDQKYVRDNKNSLFWHVMMPAANPPPYLDYLSKEAVHHQMDYIRQFYSQPSQNWILDRAYPYLNEKSMARYVAESTQILLEIHQKLNHLANLNGHTALAIISPDRLLPYDAPLGDC